MQESSKVAEATSYLIEVFSGSDETDRINAGILLFDIFRANITPLTQEVSS